MIRTRNTVCVSLEYLYLWVGFSLYLLLTQSLSLSSFSHSNPPPLSPLSLSLFLPVVNGERSAMHAPEFSSKLQRVRQELLAEIARKHKQRVRAVPPVTMVRVTCV